MALDDTISLLGQAPVIGLLERDALQLLAFSADTRRLRRDEILFREGERSDGGYVVLSGSIALTRSGSDVLTLAGPSFLIGQVALFVRVQRPASAVARELSTVLRVSPTLMRRILEEFPTAASAIRDAIAAELDGLTDGLERVRRLLLRVDETG